MKGRDSIPRNSLLWLLVAQVLVIIPHLGHLPAWIIGLWLGCTYWRLQIFRMRALYPKAWVKAVLMLATGFGVYLSRGSLVGLEAGAVLMIAAFILKIVEMRTRRDALVVIFLGFFAVVTGYLFEDSLLAALYSVLPVASLLAAMIGLQQRSQLPGPLISLKLAGTLMLQAVPLMVVLFVLFPRIGPLWGLPEPNGGSSTGLAESIAPGDIERLSQSPRLAFRVRFDGPPPPREQLYWRAITFDDFDGRTWTRSLNSRRPQAPEWQPAGTPVSYSIVMEPSGQPWLMALDVAQVRDGGAQLMGDFHLERRRPVNQPLMYEVVSWPDARRESGEAPPSLSYALQLPPRGNPRTREWALNLRREMEPEPLVEYVLRHFNREPYRYTLKPPAVGVNGIDDFLFDTRAGFCSHYAGAMVFILRAAGIPARIVGGYQGGEPNPKGNYLSVRQFDAHAWVEYWLPGRGWISVDPTFQVAPERIQQGLEQALGEEAFLEDAPFSPLRYRQIAWVNDLRLAWDNLNHDWQRWVLGYQGDLQKSLLKRWLGEAGMRWLGLILVGSLCVLIALLALWLLRGRSGVSDPAERLFQRFERLLGRQGVFREKGEGVRAFAFRAGKRLPYQAEEIEGFARLYEARRYAASEVPLVELEGALRALRKRLPWRRVAVDPRTLDNA